jgi:hypothetical protein
MTSERGGSAPVTPKCECGSPAAPVGGYWVCANPACEGHGQILRPIREGELVHA